MDLNDLKELTPALKKSETVIIDNWMQSAKEIISQHTVPEYFKDNYANSIFSYFINVIEGTSEIGNCPSMHKFLQYCSVEGFKVEDVHKVCAKFRHALSYFLIQNSFMNEKVYEQINYVLDENLSGILSIYSGIVESKNSTISLQAQWIEQYQKVMDNILIVSKADIHGKVIYANDKFTDISGYSKSELIGKPHSIVRDEDMPKAVFKNLWTTIMDKKPWSGVIKNRRKDGSAYYVSTIILPILDNNGNIVEFLSSRTDISEIFELKKETERQEKLLIKQSTLAEMGDMISLISHQWKQPLSAISAIISNILIRQELNQNSKNQYKEEYKQVEELIQYLSQTIDDFQSFFKPDKIKHNINSAKVVHSVLTLMQAKFKKLNIEVNIYEENAFDTCLFENDLKQVLLNLYNNAADVIEENTIPEGKIDISFERNDKTGKIFVKDNGGGIKPSLLPDKLFELYETSKGEKGSGIGLRLCKIIIEEKFGGRIYAQNSDDGAVFTIELPI